ncbi:MAG: glycoside hydrolase family 25 protein [Bacteroidota bacterium]|nr:glycoside hydrolase family 25 protein [Bacteroidota bacterium]
MKQKRKQKQKPKKKYLAFIFLLLFLAAGSGGYYVYHYWKVQMQLMRAEKTVYAVLGVDVPMQYSIHGIDVSSHQKMIYWPAVRNMNIGSVTITFAFIKATEGLQDTDPQFVRNWTEAGKAGITRGAYLYFLATKNGQAQAAHFIQEVQLHSGDLPPVVDAEELYGVPDSLMRKRLQDCLSALEKAYKVKPIIYSYADFYSFHLQKYFDDYPLWVAHYNEPEKPKVLRNWLFWQHSDKAHISGITTPVDLNVFAGDSLQFRQFLLP